MDITQIATALLDEVDALAEQVVALVWEKVPGYEPPRMLPSDLAQAVSPNLAAVLTRVANGDPGSEAAERARNIGVARALQGIPLDAIVLSYRNAERVLTDAFVSRADTSDIATLRDGLHRLSDAFDELATASVEGYRTTQQEVTAHYDRLAGDLVAGLVTGELDHHHVLELARMLDCDPDMSYQAAALFVANTSDVTTAVALQREILATLGTGRSGRILLGTSQGCDVLLIPGALDPSSLSALEAALVRDSHTRAHLAIGDPAPSLVTVGRSCRQALTTVQTARVHDPPTAVIHYGDVLFDIIAAADEDAVAALVERYLTPLGGKTHLTSTLDAFLDADLSIRAAAQRLYVHPNTIVYRLDRIRELTGHDPRSARELCSFVLALRGQRSTTSLPTG